MTFGNLKFSYNQALTSGSLFAWLDH